MNAYPVPAQTARIETLVVNSRFLATAGRADSVEEARAFIARIHAEMPDATHHVYAFKVGYGESVIEGMSDDGEPAGTAGPPVLAVLRAAQVGNTVIVVTRYFGGTKLGTGGLVRAYTGAAKAILAALPTTLKTEKRYVGISVTYNFYEGLKRLLAENSGEIDSQEFDTEVTVYAYLPADRVAAFSEAIGNLTAGQAAPLVLDGPLVED
jgi:uncharacterized YigZ family protein